MKDKYKASALRDFRNALSDLIQRKALLVEL